ncbi:MAG: GNAT family N-acetyltransferase [Elainella sp.]
MEPTVCRVVPYVEAEAAIQQIRRLVFQIEQQVDPALDFDGLDPAAQHILAYQQDQAVGTARIRRLDSAIVKLERVAVLADFRGQGIGQQIIQTALSWLVAQAIFDCKLHAQTQTVPFYQKLGFTPEGEEFYEAGIPHSAMYWRYGLA